MKNIATQILYAIAAGFAAGGKDEWDAPEFQAARDLTDAAGCVWDFTGWRDAADTIRNNGKLGGIDMFTQNQPGIGIENRVHATADNLDIIKEWLPTDQAAELQPGCYSWKFQYAEGTGCITVWPNGMAAIAFGGESSFGDWNAQERLLTPEDCPDTVYDSNGDNVWGEE